jgi:2-polyprenyl-6-methoxyphenol hydroxylase-like FAD-dependent oxidoreductase
MDEKKLQRDQTATATKTTLTTTTTTKKRLRQRQGEEEKYVFSTLLLLSPVFPYTSFPVTPLFDSSYNHYYSLSLSLSMMLLVTVTLQQGHATSFDQLRTKEAVEGFLLEHYPTALKLMPTAVEDFLNRPVGFLGTVFCSPWVHSAPVTAAASSSSSKGFTLIGDSAHAFTPFFGQGCNSGELVVV